MLDIPKGISDVNYRSAKQVYIVAPIIYVIDEIQLGELFRLDKIFFGKDDISTRMIIMMFE